jgi:hypothetical protein
VVAALTGDAWIWDIQGPLIVLVIVQYLQLRAMVHGVILVPGIGQCPLVLEYLQPIQLEIDVPGTTHGANNTTRREGALESEGS